RQSRPPPIGRRLLLALSRIVPGPSRPVPLARLWTAPQHRAMRANPYQEAVLTFVRRAGGHGVVEATAGSGKTTTLVMVARALVEELGVPPQRVAFLAFNRSAAAELRSRLPVGVVALTLHALGLRVLGDAGVEVTVAEDKYERLAMGLAGAPPEASAALSELARFARLELSA